MPTRFEVQVDGAVLVGDIHDVGDHWGTGIDRETHRLPMVLLHAGVVDRRSWDRVVPTWSTTRRLVTYDRRGFGESQCEPDPHDPMADLLAVMDHTGMERGVLVGNSMGGELALATALDHPDRVGGLILIGTNVSGAPFPNDVPARHLDDDAAIDAAIDAGDIELANQRSVDFWLDGPDAPHPRADPDARERFLQMHGRHLTLAQPGPERTWPPTWDRLADVAVPTLVLIGDLDLAYLRDRGRHIATRVPGGEIRVLGSTAHLPAMDAHMRTLAACSGFLDALD